MTAVELLPAWTEADSRNLTVALVAIDGYRMQLAGADRAAAVRTMVARGLDTETIAYRLHLEVRALQQFALRHRIALPPAKPPQPWWVAVATPSSATRARRRQKQAQRERATAKQLAAPTASTA